MPRDFYPSELTDRSFSVLERLVADFPDAVLIGGWGTWVRYQGAKSHDIDLIVTNADLDRMRNHSAVVDFSTTEHLSGRKYRATIDDVHLDLYVPYQSRLGRRLQLRAEDLVRYAERVGPWHVLTAPAHVATKIAALLDRPDTQPGEKDRHELLAMLGDVVPADVVEVIRDASEHQIVDLRGAISDEMIDYLADAEPSKKRRLALQALAAEYDKSIVRAIGTTS